MIIETKTLKGSDLRIDTAARTVYVAAIDETLAWDYCGVGKLGQSHDMVPYLTAWRADGSKAYITLADKATIAEIRAADAAALEAAVPGLSILRAAVEAHNRYAADFSAAMEDEMRDGVRMPSPPQEDLAALSAQYPRAAVYIRAEGYAMASNYDKASAGTRACKLLANGGEIDAAKEILDNWLPESAMWD